MKDLDELEQVGAAWSKQYKKALTSASCLSIAQEKKRAHKRTKKKGASPHAAADSLQQQLERIHQELRAIRTRPLCFSRLMILSQRAQQLPGKFLDEWNCTTSMPTGTDDADDSPTSPRVATSSNMVGYESSPRVAKRTVSARGRGGRKRMRKNPEKSHEVASDVWPAYGLRTTV